MRDRRQERVGSVCAQRITELQRSSLPPICSVFVMYEITSLTLTLQKNVLCKHCQHGSPTISHTLSPSCPVFTQLENNPRPSVLIAN